ncbi:MAG: putative toxin-antitoxin system toxin component, PIN family [Nitrospirota bacterium]
MSPRTRPRVVLDTNTIVSALYREGPARDILRLFYRGAITVVVSPFLLSELERVLTVKLRWPEDRVKRTLANLKTVADKIDPAISRSVFPKENPDNRILECAVAGEAQFIVTGDHAFLDLREHEGVVIVTAREFLATLGGL